MIYTTFRKVRSIYEKIINRIMFRHCGVEVNGIPGHIEGVITIRVDKKNSISIGSGVELRSGKAYNIIGGDTRLILKTIGEGVIRIGNNVGIANSAIVSNSYITIEDNAMIGNSCKLYDNDFHSINYEERIQFPDCGIKASPIVIKEGAFIGAHSIILKGVTIGRYSVVGAGSVVTKSIPDEEIWGGCPARFIRKLNK